MAVEVWRKAVRSEGANNCVEISNTGAVRDSKNPGPTLASAAALVDAVRRDQLAR